MAGQAHNVGVGIRAHGAGSVEQGTISFTPLKGYQIIIGCCLHAGEITGGDIGVIVGAIAVQMNIITGWMLMGGGTADQEIAMAVGAPFRHV